MFKFSIDKRSPHNSLLTLIANLAHLIVSFYFKLLAWILPFNVIVCFQKCPAVIMLSNKMTVWTGESWYVFSHYLFMTENMMDSSLWWCHLVSNKELTVQDTTRQYLPLITIYVNIWYVNTFTAEYAQIGSLYSCCHVVMLWFISHIRRIK